MIALKANYARRRRLLHRDSPLGGHRLWGPTTVQSFQPYPRIALMREILRRILLFRRQTSIVHYRWSFLPDKGEVVERVLPQERVCDEFGIV
jgi:hypothetical protein